MLKMQETKRFTYTFPHSLSLFLPFLTYAQRCREVFSASRELSRRQQPTYSYRKVVSDRRERKQRKEDYEGMIKKK